MAIVIDFLKDNLFWIFFILIAIVLLFIYSKLSYSSKLKIKNILSGKALTIFLLLLVWVVWHNRGGMTTMKSSSFYMPMIFLFLGLVMNYVGGLKYQTQQIQCANGFHGSFSKPPARVNGFLIFAIDSFNAGGISYDFASRILVLREETTEFCDAGAISIARPRQCNTWSYDLEPEIKEFIENNKYLKGRNKPVFYGYFDDIKKVDYDFQQLKELDDQDKSKEIFMKIKKEFGVENPKVSTLFWSYKNLCKALNKITEQFDSTIDNVEKGVEHGRRIRNSYVDSPPQTHDVKSGGEDY
jgi:hypothetical protein